MKPNELRIGNLVLDSTGNTTVVESIIPEHGIVRYPKPITEELLRCFGFRKDDNGVYWIDLQTHYLELIPSIEYWFPVYVQLNEMSVEDEQQVHLNRIQFAHEIQNLFFALRGEELKLTEQ